MTSSDITTRPKAPTELTKRGRRTRAALIEAAREVFEESGFADARIADITRRAGTSYGSFYTYFESKHDVFREVMNVTTGEMFNAARVGDPGLDPVRRIYEATDRYLSAYERNAHMMSVIEEVSPRDEYFKGLSLEIRSLFVQRIATGIERLQQQGLADPYLPAEMAASALGGMVEHYARVSILLGEGWDREQATITLTRLWAQAIGLTVPPETLS